MQLPPLRGVVAAIIATAWLAGLAPAWGAATAYDDASAPQYNGGWQDGSNGGIGFAPWQLAKQQNNVSTGGFFIGSSAGNGGIGNIDTAGKAFGMYANSGNTVQAFRSFTAGGPNHSPALQPGQALTIRIDNGNVDEGGAIGFHLRNREGLRRLTFEFVGGEYEYRGSGLVPFTRNGLQITFVQGRNNYAQLTVTPLGGRSVSFDRYIDASDIEQIEFFNSKAGGGAAADFFVNSISISTAGRVDPSFGRSLGIAGRTKTIALTPSGQIVVGGSFSSRVARLNSDATRDPDFLAETGIEGGDVETVLPLPDGRTIIAGSFSSVGGHARPGLARINPEGSNDWTFYVPGSPNVLTRLADGRILCGRSAITRLDPFGAEETSTTFPGIDTDGEILAIAVQPDGRILIGGSFKRLKRVQSFPPIWAYTRSGIARLNSDGTFDESFDPGSGVSGSVVAIAVQPDGAILIGGLFTAVGGTARQNLARLQPNGALDTSFTSDTNGKVGGILLRPDNKAVVVGTFTRIRGVDRSAVARIQGNGNVDTEFDTGVRLPFVSTINTHSGWAGSIPAAEPIVADSAGNLLIAPFGTLQRLHPNGARDLDFAPDVAPGPNASVGRVARSSAGGYLLGGNFTRVGATFAPGVARLGESGLHDLSFNAGLDGISFCALEQADGAVLIGQAPSVIDGVSRGGLIRVDKNGVRDPNFTAAVGGSFTALAQQSDGKIVVLRDPVAHAIGELAPNKVTRLNPNGTVDTTFQEATIDGVFITANGLGRVVIDPGGKIVIWGTFTKVNGYEAPGVARLNPNGTVDQTLELDPTAQPSDVTAVTHQSDGKIVLGTVYGQVSRFNADGSSDSAFFDAGYFWGAVNSLAIAPDGKIIVGGSFDVFETYVDYLENTPPFTVHRNVARLNSDGTIDLSFASGTGADGPVYDVIVQTGGKIMLAGDFTQLDRHDRNYVARLNSDGSVDRTFSPGVGVPKIAAVALNQTDGKVIVAGAFAAAGGQPANALARLRTDGSLDPRFQSPYAPGDSVQAIARRSNGSILAASLSSTPAGQTPAVAAKRESTHQKGPPRRPGERPDATGTVKNPIRPCLPGGAFDDSFNNGNPAGTNGVTHCLAVQGPAQSILVAGAFDQLNGADGHLNIGRLNSNGTLDLSFNATADQPVRALGIQPTGAKAILGGDFTLVNGLPASRIARLRYDSSLDDTFLVGNGIDGPVTALLVLRDEKIVIGGSFNAVHGSNRRGLARLHSNGMLDQGFVSGAVTRIGGSPQITSIVEQVHDGKIIVAGLFDAIGSVARRNIARLNPDGSVDGAYDPGAGPDAIVRSLVLQSDGKALLGGDFTTVDVYARTAAARLFGDALNGLQQWRLINFGTIDPNHPEAGDGAAPHGDGVPNLLKYALNLDASRADRTLMTADGTKGLPLVQLDPVKDVLTLTFVRRQATANPGLDYIAQFSSNLAIAGSFIINHEASTTVTPIDQTWERVTVSDSVPVEAEPQRFGRLQVTRP